MTRLLLESGANPDAKLVVQPSTPLINAICNGNKDIVEILLKYKAFPNRPHGEGQPSPIFYAVKKNRIDIIDLLIKNGADVNYETWDGNTALTEATLSGKVESIRYLIEQGANISIINIWGANLLSLGKNHANREIAAIFEAAAKRDGRVGF